MNQMRIFSVALLSITCMLGSLFNAQEPAQTTPQAADIQVQLYLEGFSLPVQVTHSGDETGRLFVVEQSGAIRIIENGSTLPEAFIDISDRVISSGEQGLLSVAFPPDFTQKGYFYVYYTNTDGNNQVSRFYLTANPDRADPQSEELILLLEHPTHSNHNGGQLAFGPDGYLYIGTGDGGGAGDPSENAQDLGSLLGKILRIDVESGNATYTAPPDNPFLSTPGAQPEIWAMGLRNPWRFSFDRETGDLYIGDVGQGEREEVDYQPASSTGGENYGWDILEGSLCYEPATDCIPPTNYVAPAAEYEHGPGNSIGCSISGGMVYRGADFPDLTGIYFYGDFCSGKLWGLTRDGSAWVSEELFDTALSISGFGEDQAGEVYVADHSSGNIYQIVSSTGLLKTFIPLIAR